MTAADFEYAWKRILNPATELSQVSMLYDVKGAAAFHQGEATDPDQIGVRALDRVTFEVELEGPTGYFLSLLTTIIVRPVPRHILEKYGEDWTAVDKMVTNGPFRLEAWQCGERLILARNPSIMSRLKAMCKKWSLCCWGLSGIPLT